MIYTKSPILSVTIQYCLLTFFFTCTAITTIYTLSLHDALPICARPGPRGGRRRRVAVDRRHPGDGALADRQERSEEHTSELQSPCNLVCRLLLEKKKIKDKLNRRRCMLSTRKTTQALALFPLLS